MSCVPGCVEVVGVVREGGLKISSRGSYVDGGIIRLSVKLVGSVVLVNVRVVGEGGLKISSRGSYVEGGVIRLSVQLVGSVVAVVGEGGLSRASSVKVGVVSVLGRSFGVALSVSSSGPN